MDTRKGNTPEEQNYAVDFVDAIGYLCTTADTYNDYTQWGITKVKELKKCENEVSRLKAMRRK